MMVQWNRRLSLPRPVLTLSILGLVVAGAAFWLVAKFPDKAQRDAISQLTALGAAVEFDDFQNVKALRIPPGTSLTALKFLADLPRVKSLVLPVADAVDDDLAPLERAPSLEELILSGNRDLTDAALKHLGELVNLKTLYLTDVPIDGSGLEALRRLTKLEVLSLSYTKLDDDKLVHLAGMPALKWLDLSYTQCSDAGLEHLRGLTKLEMLWVMAAKATPAGAAELKKSIPNIVVKFGL